MAVAGVKLCRWTKAMLRGRGGCYKHTFYGIASYQCMEVARCVGSPSPSSLHRADDPQPRMRQ
jgi:hypothetical protein